MYEFEFEELQGKLTEALKYIAKDKASIYETYIDYDNAEYKIIIEKIKRDND